ncbi:hypothetical protein CCICO_07685 [Corynebacterium ciconiae DSM 44920]|nr:hypothetical protein CCICO_07685 [Corynebacterium ciconiae DSM 44920]
MAGAQVSYGESAPLASRRVPPTACRPQCAARSSASRSAVHGAAERSAYALNELKLGAAPQRPTTQQRSQASNTPTQPPRHDPLLGKEKPTTDIAVCCGLSYPNLRLRP